ncbi:MAG: hypothetical protein AAGC93_26350 [Cyanobacteria bacterium P01_F01_bin.53]
MAAAITLSAATAEQQALEFATKLASAIATDKVANPSADLKGLNVSQNINLSTQRATFSIVVPLVQSASADGGIEFDAETVMA